MVKRFIIALVLLVIVCGGLVGFNIFRAQAISDFFANMPRPTVAVSTVKAEPVTWTPGIEAVGTVYARQGVDVASQASGVVEEIKFKPNERVKARQSMVLLDTDVERADLIAAEAAMVRDRQSLDRAKALATRGVNTAATLQTATAQLEASRSLLERLKAVIDKKDIKAPFAGTTGIVRVDVGQYIEPGTVIATLQDLDNMKADFTVPEQQFPLIHVGQAARFGTSPDEMTYSGRITGIDPKIDPASRLVSVQAEVGNLDGNLRPGQFINVRVILPEEHNVLALPQTAVVTSLYGTYVYVVQPEEKTAANGAAPAETGAVAADDDAAPKFMARQVFVDVGRRTGDQIEITGGLETGAEVVTAGQNRLSNGSPVAISNQGADKVAATGDAL